MILPSYSKKHNDPSFRTPWQGVIAAHAGLSSDESLVTRHCLD